MYLCHDCEYTNPAKLGKCPNCGAFGTFIKDPTKTKSSKKSGAPRKQMTGTTLSQNKEHTASKRYSLKHPELERVFSKGIKQGGLYLLGGEPGIGKSTLMLQIIEHLTTNNTISIAYFSGEEDISQIKEREERIRKISDSRDQISEKITNDQGLITNNFAIYQAHHLEDILTTTQQHKYDLIIIDSIQTVYTPHHDSVAGSIAQIKRCSEKISERCKTNHVACFIIGHVTKGGEIAGPKYLEHIVDVVSYLEGDQYGQYRFLRAKKNRFGPADDVGIFEMGLFGLQPVYDLKQRILQQANVTIPGNVLTVGIDNGRPVLVQLEVLLNKSSGKFPQRVTQGIDTKRLSLIIAILERYLKLNLSYFDIYVNIPGEFQFRDTGLDLALATAIYSQSKNKIVDKQLVFIGELGLGGQILSTKAHKRRSNDVKDFDIIDHQRIKHISEIVNIV